MVAYSWDFSVLFLRPDFWLKGIGVTLAYAIGTTVIGLALGVICGMAMLSRSRLLSIPVDAYIQLFRCTPLIVQVIWFYYALPLVSGINLPAWLAAGAGLTLYMGAFSAEIFRGGIISIDKGQWQASMALGMQRRQMMRRIILPQAFRRMVSPVVNQSVLQLKNTALLYLVAVPDVMYVATTMVSDTFRPLEIYTGVAAIYFILLYPLQRLAKKLESRNDI